MFSSQVLKDIFKRCIDDRCPQIAAALAYATLLALIPLAILIYKVFSTAFIDPALQLKTQNFILESLSPSVSSELQQFLLESATQSSSLNVLGFLMLLISVMAMMYTIDTALNSIWKITTPRFLMRRILVYVALLIFGPLAISLSLFISTYLASLPFISEILGRSFDNIFIYWLPFVTLWLAFSMLYKWVPDCKVKWFHAFSAATIAVSLFEIAKAGFTLYVSYFPSYKILYGALAVIPLLLIWIYLTWLIVLIGAEIAHFMEIQDK